MEHVLFASAIAPKIYKEKAIYLATFLGGPLAAGFLMAENFKHLGALDKVKKTWIATIAAMVIIVGCIFIIPESAHFPNTILPVLYMWLAYYLVQKLQSAKIKEHTENGGQAYPIWRAVVVGFISLAVILAVVFVIALIIEIVQP